MSTNVKRIGKAALVVIMIIAILNVGFAAWKTDITGSGNIGASGSWDVKVTAADIELSDAGAETVLDYSSYQLINQCTSANVSQVALQVANNKASTASNVGKHANNKTLSSWVWLVDTTRFDTSKLGTLDTEARRLLMLDGMENGYIIRLADKNTAPDGTVVPAMKPWYGGNKYIGSSTSFVNISTATANDIVGQLITESDAVIKQLRPDTYQNYALVLCISDGTTDQPENQFIIASMGSADGSEPVNVTFTDTEVSFADVEFTLPGAWAEYTVTVTNNGTVNANLSDAVIELDTETPDQLILEKPELTGETLKAGESCTLTFVVKVPADYTDALNATGKLNIKLPYSQDAVEAAPAPTHTNHE